MSNSDMSIPLKPVVLHILLALRDQDRHGYGAMQAVREQSGGRIHLQTGSFYRHLGRLIELGLVAERPAPHPGADPRRGAHYTITAPGRRLLEQQRQYLSEVLATLQVEPQRRKGTA